MAHLLAQLLKTNTQDKEEITNLCKQYNSLNKIHKRIKRARVSTYEDVEELINYVLDELMVLKDNSNYNSEILKGLFIEVSCILEAQEFTDLKNTIKSYTGNSLVKYINSPELLNYHLVNVIGEYLEELETVFKDLRYDERTVVKPYYNLKVKLIDTFIWVGGLNNG